MLFDLFPWIRQHAGISDINKDIESLKKLIVNAGQAATNPGPLVSANKTAVHFILSSRAKSATRGMFLTIMY